LKNCTGACGEGSSPCTELSARRGAGRRHHPGWQHRRCEVVQRPAPYNEQGDDACADSRVAPDRHEEADNDQQNDLEG